MALNAYITDEQLKLFAVGNESDETDVWELLAEAVSRMFDRQCDVADGFFNKTSGSVSLKSYRANGTRYLELFPYIPDSITIIDVDGTDYFEATPANRLYREKENYILFDSEIPDGTPIDVTAKYGFAEIPMDIKFACIEQGLLMWRRKDVAFADLSGVSGAIANAEFSPTFLSTVKKYRELYAGNEFFA